MRLYFNSKEESPLVASIDNGDSSTELKFEQIILENISCKTKFDEQQTPCFWIEISDTVHLTLTPSLRTLIISNG